MPAASKSVWLAWSSGKDSTYALCELRKMADLEVTGLFTTVTVDFDRVSMHSTRTKLLRRQAEAVGLPLEVVPISVGASNEEYERQMRLLIEKAKSAGVSAMAFGDLFLQDIRSYREKMLTGTGITPLFPLWGRETKGLAREMIDSGLKAILTCIDPRHLPDEFAGRVFDQALLNSLPPHVDPCGENGEFHTFVFEAPCFKNPIRIKPGEIVRRDGFIFADVLSE